jgi:hypothetical protein
VFSLTPLTSPLPPYTGQHEVGVLDVETEVERRVVAEGVLKDNGDAAFEVCGYFLLFRFYFDRVHKDMFLVCLGCHEVLRQLKFFLFNTDKRNTGCLGMKCLESEKGRTCQTSLSIPSMYFVRHLSILLFSQAPMAPFLNLSTFSIMSKLLDFTHYLSHVSVVFVLSESLISLKIPTSSFRACS